MQTIDIGGVELGYVEAGSGGPPIVFVHGWGCDHTFFAPQAQHFSESRRCVSVDLRGHHGRDAPVGSATIPTHAADVVRLCEVLGIDRPVIAGHSMGGAIALEVAASNPVFPAALVLVDPAFPVSSDVIPFMEAFVDELEAPGYRTAARDFVEQAMFMPSDDEVVKGQVIETMLETPQHVMVSEMRSVVEFSTRPAHTWALPVLNISAGQPVADHASLGLHCTDLEATSTPGVGHFNQLLAPDVVNEAMEAFFARL